MHSFYDFVVSVVVWKDLMSSVGLFLSVCVVKSGAGKEWKVRLN